MDAHFALYAALPLAIRPLRGRPLLVHFQGPWADESLAGGEGTLTTRIKYRVERSVYRRADRIVVLSSAFRRLLVERYRIDPWRIEVIPPGVDLDRFTPGDGGDRSRLGIADDVWVAVTARRLVPRMGLEVLLRSWANVTAPRGLLAIIGDGPEREQLESLARDLGVAEEVRFLGRVDDGTLVSWYRAADIAVVPSLALEGFGLVVLEALACGTPVVVSDVGGLPEAVAGLEGSRVVPAGDQAALAACLVRARDQVDRLPSREECRGHAERFDWATAVRRHREAYATAVARDPEHRRRRVVHIHRGSDDVVIASPESSTPGGATDDHVILGTDGPLARSLADRGVSCEVFPLSDASRPDDASLLRRASEVVRLARHLRRLRPDAVRLSAPDTAWRDTAAARLSRTPIAFTPRGDQPHGRIPAPAQKRESVVRRSPP